MRPPFDRTLAAATQVGNRAAAIRDPLTAAALSVVPGLGQLYNGDSTKGFLFIDVAILNFFMLTLMVLTEPILRGLTAFSKEFHSRPNNELLHSLQQLHVGTAVSTLLLLLIAGFAAYAARDAYDAAKERKLKAIYADKVIDLSETASGSYLFHAASMVTCGVLALFFIVPPAPQTQVTEIEIVSNPESTPVKHVTKRVMSEKPAENNAPVHKEKPLKAAQPAATAHARQTASAPAPAQATQPAKATPARTRPDPTPLSDVRPAPRPAERPVPVPVPKPIAPNVTHLTPTNTPAPPSPVQPKPLLAMAAPTPKPMSFAPAANLPAPPVPTRCATTGATMPLPTATGLAMIGTASAPQPKPASASSGSRQSADSGPSVGQIHTKTGTGGPTPSPSDSGGFSAPRSNSGSIGGPSPTKAGTQGSGPSQCGGFGKPFDVSPVGTKGPATGPAAPPVAHDGPGTGTNVGGKEIDMGPYMAELQRRIKTHWFPTKIDTSNRVSVTFRITVDGQLSGLKLERSSGVSTVDQAALKAVQESAPFRHLPPGAERSDILEDGKVSIQFTFDYNVFGNGGTGRVRY